MSVAVGCRRMPSVGCIPNKFGNCVRCGKHVPELGPNVRARSLDREREMTREAARGLVDPERLIAFAETRAGGGLSGEYVPNAMLVSLERDRVRDAREEAVDLRNHLVWWLEDNPDHELAPRRFHALRLLTQLYDCLLEED